uniref:RRM domain-containing protein n=1 Tax=Echinostoma caproni TaxID=27848 RepID=A0A183B4I5_9TREM
LEYCHFAISNYDPSSAESAMVAQEIFEAALSHQGLNVASGTVLWEVYREVQFLILAHLSKDPSQTVDEHLRQMDKLFRHMQNTLTEYEEFLKGVGSSLYSSTDNRSPVPPDCMDEYKKATAQLESLLEFEEKIEEDVLSVDKPRLLRTFARAVRNCPWSVTLWLRYALATEVTVTEELANGGTNGLDGTEHSDAENRAFAKVEAVFETAVISGFQEPSNLLQLWVAYCDYRLRRLLRTEKKSTEWEIQLSNLRDTFTRASSELFQREYSLCFQFVVRRGLPILAALCVFPS